MTWGTFWLGVLLGLFLPLVGFALLNVVFMRAVRRMPVEERLKFVERGAARELRRSGLHGTVTITLRPSPLGPTPSCPTCRTRTVFALRTPDDRHVWACAGGHEFSPTA